MQFMGTLPRCIRTVNVYYALFVWQRPFYDGLRTSESVNLRILRIIHTIWRLGQVGNVLTWKIQKKKNINSMKFHRNLSRLSKKRWFPKQSTKERHIDNIKRNRASVVGDARSAGCCKAGVMMMTMCMFFLHICFVIGFHVDLHKPAHCSPSIIANI